MMMFPFEIPDEIATALKAKALTEDRAPRFGRPHGDSAVHLDTYEVMALGLMMHTTARSLGDLTPSPITAAYIRSARAALTGDWAIWMSSIRDIMQIDDQLHPDDAKPPEQLRIRGWLKVCAVSAALAEAIRLGEDADAHEADARAAAGMDRESYSDDQDRESYSGE